MASHKQQFLSDYIDAVHGLGAEEHRPAKAAPKAITPKTTITKPATKPAPKTPQTILFDAQALVRQSQLGNIQATMQLATIKQQLNQRAAAGDVQSAMLLQKIQRLETAPIQPRQMMRQPYMPPGMTPSMPPNIPPSMPPDMPFEMPQDIPEGAMVGEEERELARYGGASERAALARRTGLSGEFVGTAAGPSFEQDRDMDIVERMILRAGTAHGWPVHVKKQDYEDYKFRAGQGDSSATRTLAILGRYMTAGKLRVDSGTRDERLAYAMGEMIRDSDLQDDEEDGGASSPRTASTARKGLRGGQESLRSTSRTISQAQTARSQAKDLAAAATWTAKLIHR